MARWSGWAVVVGVGVAGCGEAPGEPAGAGGAGAAAGTGGAGAGATGGAAGAGTGGSSATGGTGGAPGGPDPRYLPAVTGTCPALGDGTLTFAPAGMPPRSVRVHMSDAARTLDGPLIFYWHGTGSQPIEAPYALGAVLNQITAAGGIIAVPTHDPAAGTFPWFYTTGLGTRDDDLRLADEILACAHAEVGVDLSHIHVMGMSAGGLNTVQMAYRRSGYVASVAPYSGGLIGAPPTQDPSNPFAAMIFHGGASDSVAGVGFQGISEAFDRDRTSKQAFSFLCDHGNGHTVPTDAAGSIWQFFQDHGFGVTPSPYVGGLPGGFPAYCAL